MDVLSAGRRLVCTSSGSAVLRPAPCLSLSTSSFTISPSWKPTKWRTSSAWCPPNSKAPPPCGLTSQVSGRMLYDNVIMYAIQITLVARYAICCESGCLVLKSTFTHPGVVMLHALLSFLDHKIRFYFFKCTVHTHPYN